jgi:futalosine hydrolase
MDAAPILVLAAVERELAPARACLGRLSPRLRFHLTGAGKVSAAVETSRAVIEMRPAWVLQIGCAGAFPTSGLGIGDVAIATEEVLADEGMEAPGSFLDLRQLELPLARRGADALYNVIPVEPIGGELIEEVRRRAGGAFRVLGGRLATVSAGSGTAERARRLELLWRPLAESLEGAAAAFACWRERVPFTELRGISNLTGERSRGSWEIDRACANAARAALVLVEAFLEGRMHPAVATGAPP